MGTLIMQVVSVAVFAMSTSFSESACGIGIMTLWSRLRSMSFAPSLEAIFFMPTVSKAASVSPAPPSPMVMSVAPRSLANLMRVSTTVVSVVTPVEGCLAVM